MVCAIAAGLPSKISSAAIVIKLRIIGSPEISASLFLFPLLDAGRGHDHANVKLPADVVATQNAYKRNMGPCPTR
jgi:hypothetical protein